MCGRYAASADPDALIEAFEVEQDATDDLTRSLLARPQDPPAGRPDHNMAPTKQAPVVLTRAPRTDGAPAGPPLRQLRLLTWGLVPSWARDTGGGVRMINARAESLLSKRAFAPAARRRRALVPAQGWYEWQASTIATDRKGKPRKQPFFLTRADATPLAMAGIYEFWKDPAVPDEAGADPATAWVVSFAIVTTAAEPGLDRIHDRQPLVLDPDIWADWLDPAQTDDDLVQHLLRPSGAGRFETWPVGRAVNATANNGPELLAPAPASELEGVLDPSTGEVIGG